MNTTTLEYHNIKSILVEFTNPNDIDSNTLLPLYESKFNKPLTPEQTRLFLQILYKWKNFAAKVYANLNYQESFLDSFLNTTINGWDD